MIIILKELGIERLKLNLSFACAFLTNTRPVWKFYFLLEIKYIYIMLFFTYTLFSCIQNRFFSLWLFIPFHCFRWQKFLGLISYIISDFKTSFKTINLIKFSKLIFKLYIVISYSFSSLEYHSLSVQGKIVDKVELLLKYHLRIKSIISLSSKIKI